MRLGYRARLVMPVTILLAGICPVSHAGNFYEGNHSEWVDRLLTVTGAWDCPYNGPKIKADGCERDRQVAAAVTSAWQAECLARDGENDKASAAADEMFNHLKTAAGMCSKTSASRLDAGEKACDTETIFDCGSFQP